MVLLFWALGQERGQPYRRKKDEAEFEDLEKNDPDSQTLEYIAMVVAIVLYSNSFLEALISAPELEVSKRGVFGIPCIS